MQESKKSFNNYKFKKDDNLSDWIKEYEENYNLESDLPQEAKLDLENIFQTSKTRKYFHNKYLPKQTIILLISFYIIYLLIIKKSLKKIDKLKRMFMFIIKK